MSKKVTIEEWARKMSWEGGLEGMWDWGGVDFLTKDKEFNDAWKQFGAALETLRKLLPEEPEE